MSTQAQLDANRLNSLKSTGPKTDEGKARSSQNALTHGLTAASSPLLPAESPDSYHQFIGDIIQSLSPSTPLENVLARRIADTLWRLRRLPEAEAQLFVEIAKKARDKVQRENDEDQDAYQKQLAWRNDLPRPELRPLPEDPTPAETLARAFMKKDSRNPFCRLQRYEQALSRTLHRALYELRQLQRQKPSPDTLQPSPAAPVQNEPNSAINPAEPATSKPAPGENPVCAAAERQSKQCPNAPSCSVEPSGAIETAPKTPVPLGQVA